MHTRSAFAVWQVLFLGVLLVLPAAVQAQTGALTLTVTPPLVQINLRPGEAWTSGIQVVNGNPYTITVYAKPTSFSPSGEDGRPVFTTLGSGADEVPNPATLAGWITVPTGAITIPQEETYTIPVTIAVPPDAAPGGHYAAILIGNEAPEGSPEESTVSVTSSIASLILLRVAGDIVEDGRIRDFATERMVYDTPRARLSLRFENQGNVHLQPRGEITIYNMFGKIRGRVEVNQSGAYGNVMPGSIRKFSYNWESAVGVWDIGRYRAETTIGYGAESKQFASATTYFYVLPLIPLAQVIGGLLATVLFLGWAIKAYVRRAIAIESRQRDIVGEHVARVDAVPAPDQARMDLKTLVRPIQAGIVDLRSAARGEVVLPTSSAPAHSGSRATGVRGFIATYRYFFVFLVCAAVLFIVGRIFFSDVMVHERPYAVEVVGDAVE